MTDALGLDERTRDRNSAAFHLGYLTPIVSAASIACGKTGFSPMPRAEKSCHASM